METVADNEITTVGELKSLQSEIIRKNKKCRSVVAAIMVPAVLLVILFLVVSRANILAASSGVVSEVLLGVVIFLIVRQIVIGKDIVRFNRAFKQVFVREALEKVFSDLSYVPEQGLAESVITETGMMSTGDRYRSNDYVAGKYKEIGFLQSDVHIEERREEVDEDGNRRMYWETIFLGRWMIFDFNKKFLSNICVVGRGFQGNFLRGERKYTRMELEDGEFNRMFAVYAQDGFEAFYVMPPDIMERMKKLAQALGCGMMFGFAGTKLHVAVNNKQDSFEYDVFREIDEKQIMEDIVKDIRLITQFAEELKLDRKLFSN